MGQQPAILLIEDETRLRHHLQILLQSEGYHVVTAGDGAEGIQKAYAQAFDLVITDLVMPEMDGPTLFERLRRARPDLKVIFISGYAEDAFRQHLAENEDFMFLQKPFDLKELAAAVKTALQD